jgi:competence protein ComEC
MENRAKNFKFFFLGLLFLIAALVWYAVFSESREELEVAFLDVGQGDAIFIQALNGNQILIDTGPNKQVLRELSNVMPFYDRSIDMLIATHPDSDHIGGMPDILDRFKIDYVLESGAGSESAVYSALGKIVEEKNINKILARRGMKINFGESAYLLILFPDRDVSDLDSNDASIVAKLVYANTSFLLAGDSPSKIEKYLAELSPESLDINVLKIGHHGSRTSSSEILLGYSSPDFAVISSGKDNRYGHPHQEVLDLLDKFGIKVLRTDELGTIVFKTNGENITISPK